MIIVLGNRSGQGKQAVAKKLVSKGFKVVSIPELIRDELRGASMALDIARRKVVVSIGDNYIEFNPSDFARSNFMRHGVRNGLFRNLAAGDIPDWALFVWADYRRTENPDFWINIVLEKIASLTKASPDAKIVVSGVVYGNELVALEKSGGVFWRVVAAPDGKAKPGSVYDSHPDEAILDIVKAAQVVVVDENLDATIVAALGDKATTEKPAAAKKDPGQKESNKAEASE